MYQRKSELDSLAEKNYKFYKIEGKGEIVKRRNVKR